MPRTKPPPEPCGRGGKRGPHARGRQGSVYPTADGRYRGSFTWTDPESGQSRRLYVTGADEKAARKAITERRAQLARGIAPADADLSVDAYLAQWLSDVVRPQRATRTYETYLHHCRRVSAAIGAVLLSRLTTQQIQHAYTGLLAGGYAVSTLRVAHSILHAALSHAVKRRRLLDRNPADNVVLPRLEQREVEAPSVEQVRAILAYAAESGDPLTPLWTLIASTGLRRGEALGLRWQDVDLERGVLAVAQQLVKPDGGAFEQTAPKTRAGRRVLDLAAPAVAALRAHRSQVAGELGRPPSGLVFVTTKGEPWNPKTIDSRWWRMLKRGSLPHTHLHALRHSVATWMGEAGEPPRVVQEFLGHADVRTTLSTYSHVTPTMHRRAVRGIEGLLWPETEAASPPEAAES